MNDTLYGFSEIANVTPLQYAAVFTGLVLIIIVSAIIMQRKSRASDEAKLKAMAG